MYMLVYFCLALASVYLSTKWSMESTTGLRELRGAPPGLAGQPPCRVWHCLSHPLSPQAQLSRTGRAGVYLFFFIFLFFIFIFFYKVHQWVSDVLNCPLRVGLDSRCM